MNNPILYERNNKVQRLEVQRLLEKYSSLFEWRSDGTDSLLDIGCAGADVTIDLILPILPKNFGRLVGADVSTKMVEYARKKYTIPNVSFEQLDMEMELESQSLYGSEQFDVIFFCLLWIQNQMNALRTVFRLLKPGGCTLLAFPSRASTFAAFECLFKQEKWTKYMHDFRNFIPIYYYVESPVDEMRHMLLRCGFSEFDIDVVENEHIFSGAEEGKNFYRAISPFIDRIPAYEQDDFLNDMFCACQRKLTYQELVVFARK